MIFFVQFYCRAHWKIGFVAKRVTLFTVTVYFNLVLFINITHFITRFVDISVLSCSAMPFYNLL